MDEPSGLQPVEAAESKQRLGEATAEKLMKIMINKGGLNAIVTQRGDYLTTVLLTFRTIVAYAIDVKFTFKRLFRTFCAMRF